MEYANALNIVSLRLGNREDLKPKIAAEFLLAQEFEIHRCVQFTPWFLVNEDFEDWTVPINQGYVALPTSYLDVYEHGFLYPVNADGITLSEPLPIEPYDTARARNRTDGTEDGQLEGTEPVRGAIVNERLYVFPINQREWVFKARYYSLSDPLTADSPGTHPILKYAADWLVAETGYKVALFDGQVEEADMFKKEAAIAKRRVETETLERLRTNYAVHKGGSR